MSESLFTFPAQLDALHLLLAAVALISIAFCLFAKCKKTVSSEESEPAPKSLAKTDEKTPTKEQTQTKEIDTNQGALQLLSLLQQEGRFIDFLQEDVTHFSDEEVGAASRVIHQGCKKTLNQIASLSPICELEEESSLTLDKDYDKDAYLLTGQVTGEPPFTGTLVHAGWKADKFEMPKLTHTNKNNIIAKAEVEL